MAGGTDRPSLSVKRTLAGAPNGAPEALETNLYGLFLSDLGVHVDRKAVRARAADFDAELPEEIFAGAIKPALSSFPPPPMPPAQSELSGSVLQQTVPSAGQSSLEASHAGRRGRTKRRRAPDADLPEIGAILDKFRLEELMGMGGFAAVYRATHLMLQMPVAIKLLRPKVLRSDPGLGALLCEEARFAAKINHPNVARVYDVSTTDAITYIVMEYIEGGTLADAIELQGRVPVTTVLRIGIDVAKGLKAALEQGLIHRDIKPANILVTRTQEAKIVDLGLAHMGGSRLSLVSEKGGVPGLITGTPGYMAPEQVTNPDGVDFRADIYSLGVTLYHAAVGAPPFPTIDAARCIQMHRNDPVASPETIVAGLPRPFAWTLLRMLEKKPADRPNSYDGLIGALTRTLERIVGGAEGT